MRLLALFDLDDLARDVTVDFVMDGLSQLRTIRSIKEASYTVAVS
jgi:hypothetical protein